MDTQRGKALVLCNGFLMATHRQSSDGLRQFWRCQMHFKGCHGRAVSAVGSTTLKETAHHDIHVASPVEAKQISKANQFTQLALSPLFPIEFWNCFSSVLDNQARTNNAIEGWHRVFNQKFSKRNLNLSHFIIKLKEEEHTTWQLALRHAANPADPLRNPRSTKQINSERQISKLVTNFVEVDRANRQRLPYLRSLQFHLAVSYTCSCNG
ncbi:FLYWCH zinc finger domain-containing protein [Ditylenchus destructor]|uniref:FLYWCH zinc finger domain-containing protein n=1 Tax=Ditylenchus destructor TaxID=166010 RepID=A0AAD4NEG5_9BILA|nr:FLYWCH zinc finger domain-containing protein [Ditylenchus destructor]